MVICICLIFKMYFSNRQYVFVQLSQMAGQRTIYFAASGPSLGSHEDRFIEDLLVLHCSKSAPHKKNNLNWLWIVLCLSVFIPQRKLGRIFEPNIFLGAYLDVLVNSVLWLQIAITIVKIIIIITIPITLALSPLSPYALVSSLDHDSSAVVHEDNNSPGWIYFSASMQKVMMTTVIIIYMRASF